MTEPPPLRLLSWNVNRAVAKLDRQADAVLEREPDVVALQEVTATTFSRWSQRLRELLPHVACGIDRVPAKREPTGPRRLMAFVASRWPLGEAEPASVPWPETVVSTLVELPGSPLELHAVHVPNSRNGWIKVETLEALFARVTREPAIPRIVCGDLNTPRRELADGEIVTFARDGHRRLRPERGERWDRAEAALLTEAREHGMVDVFRHLHGYERRELSWTWPRFPRSGYRLDHVIASVERLRPLRCEYAHELRTAGLSDHSAIVADFAPAGTDAPRR